METASKPAGPQQPDPGSPPRPPPYPGGGFFSQRRNADVAARSWSISTHPQGRLL